MDGGDIGSGIQDITRVTLLHPSTGVTYTKPGESVGGHGSAAVHRSASTRSSPSAEHRSLCREGFPFIQPRTRDNKI